MDVLKVATVCKDEHGVSGQCFHTWAQGNYHRMISDDRRIAL